MSGLSLRAVTCNTSVMTEYASLCHGAMGEIACC